MPRNIPTAPGLAGDRDGDPVGDQIAVADLLHHINRKIRHVSRNSAGAGEVTFGQIRALRQLRLCGEPIRMSELADRLGIVRRSVTTVVDDLESAGLVTRLPDPHDRRATLVTITEAGLKVLHRALDRRRSASAAVLTALSEPEVKQLRRLLSLVADHKHNDD